MQDIQNIPNPDVNSTAENEDFGSHSELAQDLDNDDIEQAENVDADKIPNVDSEITADEKKTHVIQPPIKGGKE